MDIEVLHKPAQAMARVVLNPGEELVAETGAMVGMSTNVDLQTSTKGGVMSGLKRLFGGESFFLNRYRVPTGQGEVLLAPALCGDMTALDVPPEGWMIQSSAFVASEASVTVETKLKGFKTFFAGAGVFVLKATGKGRVLVNAFGALEEVQVNGTFVVDTGHLVAWDTNLPFRITKASGGWIGTFLSGEGLVCTFTGTGRVWLQTRNPVEYGRSVGRMLPPRQG